MNKVPQDRYALNRSGVAPAAGGAQSYYDKPTLPLGGYSNLENVRLHGTALEMRGGLTPHNQTAEASAISNLYSYRCDRSGVLSFFAQLSDGDVLEADEKPPTTAGANDFGDVVMDYTARSGESTASPFTGSFSKIDDTLLHSNGGMQHLIWPGPDAAPRACYWQNSAATPVRVNDGGIDYTNTLTDNQSSSSTTTLTYTIANYDGLYICCDFKANAFTLDLATVADGTTTAKVQSFNGTGFVDATTGTDGTSGLQQDGTITFTAAAGEVPTFMFGQSGYWYRLYLSAGDATETVSFVEVSYTGDWQPLTNVMDFYDYDVIEVAVEGETAAEFRTYAASTVDVSGMTSGTYVYIATTDPVWALFIDPGSAPNTTASTDISAVELWTNASGWSAVSGLEDGTSGISKSGVVSWIREDYDKRSFNGSVNHLYWLRFKCDDDMSDSVTFGITAQSFFEISDFGETGRVSMSWKDRGVYTFGKFPRDLYVSRKGRPNILNGDDFAILSPGDGRRNPVVAMANFHNELMVWQQEQGTGGGCLTIFEGYSPSTFGKLVISTKFGTFSPKSVCVTDGSLLTTRRDETVQMIAFFISHYGVFMCDGRVVKLISEDIQNYFEPSYAECITRGQEDKMWIGFDSSKMVLRLGLVSGSGATSPNIFPVYDLMSGTWSFDTFPTGATGTGIYPTCFAEVEANSGDSFSLQYLGDIYGRVYKSDNSITYDKASTSEVYITSKSRAEFSNGGNLLDFRELTLRASANSDYTLTKKIYINGNLDTNATETFTMSDDDSGDTYRERILAREYTEFQLSIELSWVDGEEGGDPAPSMYDFIYDIGAEPKKG
jgi:hypothetical protein